MFEVHKEKKDTRDIKTIEEQIKKLTEDLKLNKQQLKEKKTLEKEQKHQIHFQNTIKKPRKTFAFKINIDKIDEQQSKIIAETLNQITELKKAKITRFIILKNIIYIKTNINITISEPKYNLNDGKIIEQIEPTKILENY